MTVTVPGLTSVTGPAQPRRRSARRGHAAPRQASGGPRQHGGAGPQRGSAGPREGSAGPRQRGAGPRRGRAAGGSPVIYLLVLAGCGGGLWWVSRSGGHGVRGGTLAMAGALLLAALARLVLPESRAGMLASRTRMTDVLTFAVLAAGLLAAGLMLQT